jgi:hypothetical protein
MRTRNSVKYSLVAMVAGAMALNSTAAAAPVLSSTVAVRHATPDQASAVGYYYRDSRGAWVNGPVALGFVGGSVIPFYGLYLPYGPVVAYRVPVLAPNPYYPSLYPFVRSTRYRPGY